VRTFGVEASIVVDLVIGDRKEICMSEWKKRELMLEIELPGGTKVEIRGCRLCMWGMLMNVGTEEVVNKACL
jgi:hypothetical protein